MLCTLMHADHAVCTLHIDEWTGKVQEIISVTSSHLPFSAYTIFQKYEGTSLLKGKLSYILNTWLGLRSISKHREDYISFRNYNHVNSQEMLSIKHLASNLSDAYWIKPADSNLIWDDINFYENPFTSYFDDPTPNPSPDMTTNGNLLKYWGLKGKKRVLYKYGTDINVAESFNEKIASKLLDILKLPHVQYDLSYRKIRPYDDPLPFSVCPCFTSKDIEYVPAWEILTVRKKSNHENLYQHFLRCMDDIGLTSEKGFIENMIRFDFLINNVDRHMGNFGFLRNVETLEWIGMAPLFDHGNSLWFDEEDINIRLLNQEAKPFRSDQNKQIKLVTPSESFLKDLSETLLSDTIKNELHEIPNFSEDRINRIAELACARYRMLSVM